MAKMFSILAKNQDVVNVEDLEALQNEIEELLVVTVTQKWQLECDMLALNASSPDPSLNLSSTTTPPTSTATTVSSSSLQPAVSSSISGKLRQSTISNRAQNLDLCNEQPFEAADACDAISPDGNNEHLHNTDSNLNPLINDDSVGSEMSMASSQTGSTIIIASTTLDSNQGSQNSTSTSTIKRSHKGASEDKPSSKRFRPNTSASNSSISNTGSYAKRIHSKNRSKVVPSKFQLYNEEPHSNHLLTSRNEAPDRLWPFIEQFCTFPTQGQISELVEMIKAMDNDKEYFRVPALGKKSSPKDSPNKSETGKNNKEASQSATDSPTSKSPSKGSKNSLESELTSGSASTNHKGAGQSGVATGIKKTSGKSVPANNDDNNRHEADEEAGLGALTQRLVSCLIEENNTNGKDPDGDNNKKKTSKAKGKKVDLNNAKNLEKRIRQELEEYQILNNQDDLPYGSEDDEVLRELKACQHELALIQSWNKESMLQLARKAKNHLELEAEREKLKEANADVIAAYVKLIQAKQKKRNPTKKEKDSAWKALKVQEAIYNKCEDLYLSNLSSNYL